MSLTRPPAIRRLGIIALVPRVGRFDALSSVRSSLTTLLIVAGTAAAHGDLRLVEAARNRDQQAVRTLLNQKADVDVRSHDGATALLWAAHWNDLDTVDLLIR
jgi:ankyrin repeat protein